MKADLGAHLRRKCQLRYIINFDLPGIEFPDMVCRTLNEQEQL